MLVRRFGVVVVLVLVAGSCGDDGDSGSEAQPTTPTVATSTTETTPPPTPETTGGPPLLVEPYELSVEPATGLDDGDIVTVTGRGLANADVVVIGQCLDVEPLTLASCQALVTEGDEGYFVKARAGTIETSQRVSAMFTTADGTLVDCREPATGCALVVSSILTPAGVDRLGSTVPIAFDPDGVLSAPGATMSPSADLVDGQALSVSVWGLEPEVPVFVGQCVTEDGAQVCEDAFNPPRALADSAGRVDATVFAQVEFRGEGRSFSCRALGSCTLRIGYLVGDGVVEKGFPLSFDPDAPLATPPAVELDPATGLVDGQTVTMSASGFVSARASTYVVQCVDAVGVDSCDFAGSQEARVDNGALEADLRVRAVTVTGDGREVDCRVREAGCLVAVTVDPDAPAVRWGQTALSFDPDASLAATPTLRIAEGDTFVDRTYVTVIGEGFTPASVVSQPVQVWMCPVGAERTDDCDGGSRGGSSAVDDDGHFEVTVPLLTEVIDSGGVVTDCRIAGSCRLVATQSTADARFGLPIIASRSATAPITVTDAPREVRYLQRVFDDIENLGPFAYGIGTDGDTLVELTLDVYLPAGDTATDRPVILYGNADEFVPRGFVVIWPRIPGVEASRASIEQAYENTLPVFDWLADNADDLGIDPDKVAAMGHSRGGFIATSLAYGPVAADDETSRLGAAISMAGGALPDLIEAGEPPTLYFHGDQDTRAPYALVQDACETAADLGVDCRLVVYVGRGHPEVNDAGHPDDRALTSDLRYDIWQKTAEFLVDVFDLVAE